MQVIIAGAGGAAHLPGMLAAVTPLPVIGVPVPLKHLDGMDSLLSIVQMPAGVPVATVGVGNARNAGLLAARILGGADAGLRERMVHFQSELRRDRPREGRGGPRRRRTSPPRLLNREPRVHRVPRVPRVPSVRRLVGLDVARCLALLGMVATHVLQGRDADGSLSPAQWLAGGRASALFAVLAGLSLVLMARTTDRAGLAVRALLVALLGLALGELPSGLAVILTYYGLLFLLGLAFLSLRARPLALLSAGWVVVAPMCSHLLRPAPPRARVSTARPSGSWPNRVGC